MRLKCSAHSGVSAVQLEDQEWPKKCGHEPGRKVASSMEMEQRIKAAADARVDPKKNEPMLNEAALEAARQWAFTPALTNNHPVLVWVALRFRFILNP